MQRPSSSPAFEPALVNGHAPGSGRVTPFTPSSCCAQQRAATQLVSSGFTALYSPAKLIRTLGGSPEAAESYKGGPDSSPPTVPHEVASRVPQHHHRDDDFSHFLPRPWYAEGDFENMSEDLSIASSVATLWSTRANAPCQDLATPKQDSSVLMGKLGLQVTSLATSKPLPLSRHRQRAVFSFARAAHLCKGFGMPGRTAVADCAPGSGDHKGAQRDKERVVRPQESGDSVFWDIHFDSKPATSRASTVSTACLKNTEIRQADLTCPHTISLSANEAKYVLSPEVRFRQVRTTHYSKLTTGSTCSDPDIAIPTSTAGMSPAMTSPQRTRMTINKITSMRTSTSTGRNLKRCLTGDERNSPTPRATGHSRTESSRQVPQKVRCSSTAFKKYSECSFSSKQNEFSGDTMEAMWFPSLDSTGEFPTIDSFRPSGPLSKGLNVVERRSGDFTNEENDSGSRRTQEVSASGDFRFLSTRQEKADPHALLDDGSVSPATAGSKTESGEIKNLARASVSSDRDNVGSFSDFFSGVILDPHFTSTPVTIHKDLGGSPAEETSWQGLDVFPRSEYFKTFESFPVLTGAEESSMAMSGEVYESVSTGFPPRKYVVITSTTNVLGDKQSCVPAVPVEEDIDIASTLRLSPPRECMSSVDSFFTVTSFDEDSLSTVLCSSSVQRNCPAGAFESKCPKSPRNGTQRLCDG